MEEMRDVPGWKVHWLTGGRKEAWSVHVTRNWRITLKIDPVGQEIFDPDYEDFD